MARDSNGPSAARSPDASAAAVSSDPRVLGDDVTRARIVGDLSSVASRSGVDPEPRRDRLALGPPRRVLAAGQRAGQPAVDDEHRDVGGDRHRFDREFDRQSMSSACPARPNSAASWSIRPPGTPVASTSASSARRAASGDSSGSPPRSASASTSATASAELDDSPEPDGHRRRDAELGARRRMRRVPTST